MPDSMKCRHGIYHRDPCSACAAEYQHLEKFRADRRRTNNAAIAKAQELGRSHTFIDTDGCEVTATPDGHVFYNMADWY